MLDELDAKTGKRELDAIVALNNEMGSPIAEEVLQRLPEVVHGMPELVQAYQNMIFAQEAQEVEQIMANRCDNILSFADVASPEALTSYNRVSDIFNWIYFKNFQLAFVVGSGQLPVTAFHIHDRTNVNKIVCVDIRPEAISTTEVLATAMKMKRLGGLLCDGAHVDFRGAQFVYVANMVRGKDRVVERILQTAPSDVQIVVREPVGLGQLWTEKMSRTQNLGLHITKCGKIFKYLSHDRLLTKGHVT